MSQLCLEGSNVATNVSTQAGQFIDPTYNVKVTNGLLTVRLADNGGVTSGWALDALDVVGATILDVPPTVTIVGAPAASSAGTPITLGSTVTDPSPVDMAAGFTYAWSVTRNGAPYASATGAWPTTRLRRTTRERTWSVCRPRIRTAARVRRPRPPSPSRPRSRTCRPTPDALGPYTGAAGIAMPFVAIAQDPSTVDSAAGFTYAWKFGDGATATGATPNHTYAAAGTYTVTLTVTDENGLSRSTTTTATVGAAGCDRRPRTEYQIDATNLLANVQWDNPN